MFGWKDTATLDSHIFGYHIHNAIKTVFQIPNNELMKWLDNYADKDLLTCFVCQSKTLPQMGDEGSLTWGNRFYMCTKVIYTINSYITLS